MKIAVIAKTRLKIAEPFQGGLESFTHTICKEYERLGHNVVLYAHADSDSSFNTISFYGSKYRDNRNFELYENDEYISIIRDIESRNFDIIHNNSTHELPIIWGMHYHVPVITTLHTPPISKLKAALLIASKSSNVKFITVSNSFQKTWNPYTLNGSTVIHNGVNLNEWPLTRRDSNYLFWYGRIVDVKGLDIALDVAHRLNIPLHFAGSKDDNNYFDRQISPRIKEKDVYLGHLSQRQIIHHMKCASVLINATRWDEPFGLTTIEAMSAGVPVAGFDRGALAEILNSNSGVVAKNMTIESLAEAASEAMKLFSQSVHEEAAKYSLSTMANKYIDYFERLL